MVLQSPVPVVLDCYADWCAPCKQLTPELESAVVRAGGPTKIRFAMLNVDEEPELAEKMQVKSLPTVFGISNGRLVGPPLVGNSPVADLDAFMAKLLEAGEAGAAGEAAPNENPLAQAAALLEEGDAQGAAAVYKQAYTDTMQQTPPARPPGAPTETPEEAKAAADRAKEIRQQAAACLVGLATCAHVAGDAAARGELLQALKEKHAAEVVTDASLRAAISRLELSAAAPDGSPDGGDGSSSSGSGGVSSIAGLEAALAAAEAAEVRVRADHGVVSTGAEASTTSEGKSALESARDGVLDARMALARALFNDARFEEAVNMALSVLKEGGLAWRDGAGRDLCMQFFDALGPGSELAQKGRRRMANFLFR